MKQQINGYALALFTLAKEDKKIKKSKNDANLIIDLLSKNSKYINLLTTKRINYNKKYEMIDIAFKGILNHIKNFIKILSKEGKASIILPILKKLIKHIDEMEGIKNGIIYSKIPLTKVQINKIEKNTIEKLKIKVKLVNKIDSKIIAGVKVVIDDEIIEDTIKSRLKKIKQKLLREEN